MKKYLMVACIMLFISQAMPAQAQELVFSFKNPSFGGNSFNGGVLLNLANAQNDFEEVDELDLLEDFRENLQRSILNRLTEQITTQLLEDDLGFGEDGVEPGQFQIGNFNVDVSSGLNGLNVNIFDSGTGGETRVEIPFF